LTGSVVAGHLASNQRYICLAWSSFVDKLTFTHYKDTVRQFQQFVEIFAHEKHGRTAVACGNKGFVDEIGCLEIETEAGIGSDQYLHFPAGKLTG
jgi:hypothetical protein